MAFAIACTHALSASAEQQQSRAELINACIKEARSSLKPGHVLSNTQRMMAEEQCRAYADAQIEQNSRQAPEARQGGESGENRGTAGPEEK